jgi:toxin YoeB
MWQLVFTKQAQKDAKKIARSGLKSNAARLLQILKEDPYRSTPPYEKLLGDLSGAFSRRINLQHRLVYQTFDEIKTVKVIRMWTHYE